MRSSYYASIYGKPRICSRLRIVYVLCLYIPRSPQLFTVHPQHDYLGEEVSMAVYRVQVMWSLWYIR